jgi:hypothetical protein
LREIDLRAKPEARSFTKQETVAVAFATQAGELSSRVGANRYQAGDALLAGADGDRWCVSRERFDAGYVPLAPTPPGAAGHYRNRPRPVLAVQMSEPFRCQRSAGGDWLQGQAGDWLLQYAPGDYGVATHARFTLVYRLLAAATTPGSDSR